MELEEMVVGFSGKIDYIFAHSGVFGTAQGTII